MNFFSLKPLKNWRLMIILLIISLLYQNGFSQFTGNEITVNVNVVPPYSARLYEYSKKLEEKLIVTLTNTTTTTYNVYLVGTISGDNGTSISTIENYKPPQSISVPPGTLVLNSNSLGFDFLDQKNVEIVADAKTKNMILKDGIIPEGTYSFCIQVLDYNTNQNLSQTYPMGCSILPIAFLQPPVITNPMDQTDVFTNLPQFAWTPVTGNLGKDIITYDLFILKLLEGQNPDDAMLQAVNYNIGNPLKKTTTIPAYVYLPSDWPLEDSATYAVQVIAKSAQGLQPILNDGKSEVITFKYISNIIPPPPSSPSQEFQFTCNCNHPQPAGSVNTNPGVSAGSNFILGEYSVTVTSISDQSNTNGTFSGEGTLPFPLSSGTVIPLEIVFTDIQLNSSNEALSGYATAKVDAGAGFIPAGNSSDEILTLTAVQLQDLKNYFNVNPDHLVGNATGASIQLPLGLNDLSNGNTNTVAVIAMYFTTTNASFDAAVVLDLPDATPNMAGFSKKYICLSGTNICNNESALYLNNDLTLDLLTDQGDITLKGWNSNLSTPSDSGTYVVIDKDGMKSLRIQADYTFALTQIVQEDGVTPVSANIRTSAQSWTNWIGQIEFNTPFIAPDINDFIFDINQPGYFDHSDLSNLAQMPSWFSGADPTATSADWTGILLPFADVSFPGQNVNLTANGPVRMYVQSLIIDNQGVSVDINEADVLDITEGNIAGWNFSIDNINMNLFKNSFTQGQFSGKMLLPIAYDTSYVTYSCVLSINNGDLDYQFAINSRDDLKVPMWKAKMDLEESSTIDIQFNAGVFSANANLNGKMSINGNVGMLKKIKMNGIEFESLAVGSSNNTPTLTLGTFSSGDGKKKLSGFSLDIKSITAIAGSDPGIQIHTNIRLCDQIAANLAETKFNIVGEKTTNTNRTYYDFKNGIIDSLKIKGDLSIFKLKGNLHFFDDDATFGDGFKGWIQIEIPKTVKISSNIQFGTIEEATDTFNYWYFDAMADLAKGIPMFPGLNAYGFGGGAYYHMTRTPPPSMPIVNVNEEDYQETGAAPSGVRYVPDKSQLLGFKATLLFGLTERKTFNADVTLEIGISEETEGISNFFMYGNARVLQKQENDTSKAMVKAGIEIYYGVEDNVFHANMNARLKMEAVEAAAEINIHYEDAGWYIKFGRPRPNQGIELNILNMFELTSYFQAGNLQIDPVPPIPARVQSILSQCGISPDFYGQRMDNMINSGKGMIFGADMVFDYKGNFLIFKGELFAEAGFDFALMNVDKDCDGNLTPDTRWYAYGQLYAAIEASISIHINLLFIKTDIEVLSIGAGAVLTGGTPDPTWVNGAVGGYFSVLDGLIEGHCNFKFSYGDQCIMATNALEDLEIISDIYPNPDGNTSGLGIDLFPVIATNLKIADDDFTLDEIDEQGHVNSRTFRFNKDNLTFQLKKGNNTVLCSKYISDDKYGMTMMPQSMLEPESSFSLVVTATIDEFINGAWHPAQLEGQDFAQTKTVNFTTGKGLETLNDEDVLNTIPYQNQRSFFYTDVAQGMIKTFQNIDFSHFELPDLSSDYTTEFIMEFIPMGASQGSVLEVPVTDEAFEFDFDFPAGLQPNTIYCVQLLARWTKQQTPNAIYPIIFELQTLHTWNSDGYAVTQSQREININKLSIAANEKKLYAFYFKTSEFLGFQEKLSSLEVNEAVFNITEFSYHYFDDKLAEGNNDWGAGYVYIHKDEMATPQEMVNNIKDKLNIGATEQIPMLAPSEVCMIGDEPFDVFDIEGYTNTITKNGVTRSVSLDPLVSLDNNILNGWLSSLMHRVVDTLCSTGEATELKFFSYNKKIGGYVVSKEINHPSAPPLTEAEIFDGTEMWYNIPKNSSTCMDRKRSVYTTSSTPAGNETTSMTYNLANTMIAVSQPATTKSMNNFSSQYAVLAGKKASAFAISKTRIPQIQSLPTEQGKVNVIDVSYRYLYKPGEGIPTIPNIFLDKTMGFTDPSPEMSVDYWGIVGVAYDMITEEIGGVNQTGSAISASFIGPASSAAAVNSVEIGNVANVAAGY